MQCCFKKNQLSVFSVWEIEIKISTQNLTVSRLLG
jgi:PIN domain nuclease of toxin-antitoxin system